MTSTLQQALAYRRRGFSVIPIKPKDKTPLIAWEPYQTEVASESTIKHWFESFANANIGLVTGAISDCVVIDPDSEEAKNKLKELLPNYDLSKVPRSHTGKGWHLFFKHPGVGIPNRTGVLPNVDVRGDGGYVVAPPSIHPNGKEYKWEVPLNGPLPELPVELFKLISAPAGNTESGYRERFDTAGALAGVPEGQRDATVFKLACKLRNADVPRDMAEGLVIEAARNCQPPFSERAALDKVARAYQKYEPRDQQPRPKQAEIWPELLSAKDLLQLPPDPTRWIWDRTLPAGGASILVAKPKIGKTHLAVNLSIAVARGIPFLGRDTQQCGVVYLSLDASLPEITETFLSFGLKETDPVYLHAGAAPSEALKWVMQRVNEKSARFVVVDTLQRLFRFQNVNDYSEVTNALEPLLEGARQQNCHVLFTHHAKKDAGDDLDSAIGSTAIRGLAYTYLHMKRLPNSERRILRSDQRGGKNISETAIGFDRATGWLEIQGTMEEAEIKETEPKILEFLQSQDTGVTEKDILRAVNVRAMIVSKALRQLFRNNHVERSGKGKKGDPFQYLVALSVDSLPGLGVKGEGGSGRESAKLEKPIDNNTKILFPESREENGKSTEENLEKNAPGRESDESKNRNWERVSR